MLICDVAHGWRRGEPSRAWSGQFALATRRRARAARNTLISTQDLDQTTRIRVPDVVVECYVALGCNACKLAAGRAHACRACDGQADLSAT